MQTFDTLSESWFKVIKIYAAAKLETVMVNFLKVMIVFGFYANEVLSHALTCLSSLVLFLLHSTNNRLFQVYACCLRVMLPKARC